MPAERNRDCCLGVSKRGSGTVKRPGFDADDRGCFACPRAGRSGPWIVALGIALVLAVQPIWPDRTAVAVAGAIALTLVAAARWQLRWLPVVVLVLCGLALRLSVFGRRVVRCRRRDRAARS